MPGKILVTPRSVTRSGHPALEKLRAAGWEVVFCRPGAQPDEAELRALLTGCQGYLAGVEPVTAAVLEAAPQLRAISRNGTGTDNIDLAAAARLGIQVVPAEGANARGVAELTLGLILSLARGIPASDAALKCGEWSRPSGGCELEGKTLGLIGCGRVGQGVATLALAFGMKVMAYDPFPPATLPGGDGFQLVPLERAVEEADFLTLHCPPPADGRPVLGATRLGSMKQGAWLINTARHDLIEVEAVLAALDSGALAGLATDVFDTEPPTDARLARHPKVIATPHLGGFTKESIDRAMHAAVDNLLAALSVAQTSTTTSQREDGSL